MFEEDESASKALFKLAIVPAMRFSLVQALCKMPNSMVVKLCFAWSEPEWLVRQLIDTGPRSKFRLLLLRQVTSFANKRTTLSSARI